MEIIRPRKRRWWLEGITGKMKNRGMNIDSVRYLHKCIILYLTIDNHKVKINILTKTKWTTEIQWIPYEHQEIRKKILEEIEKIKNDLKKEKTVD